MLVILLAKLLLVGFYYIYLRKKLCFWVHFFCLFPVHSFYQNKFEWTLVNFLSIVCIPRERADWI